ncbi:hypothetical protein T12_10849, partial [Trichinella patagoniensis]
LCFPHSARYATRSHFREFFINKFSRNSQNAEMPNSNSSVLSSFKLINVKMREDFFEDLLKNIGKYHLGKCCYNF